jgi:hypothetical protein
MGIYQPSKLMYGNTKYNFSRFNSHKNKPTKLKFTKSMKRWQIQLVPCVLRSLNHSLQCKSAPVLLGL